MDESTALLVVVMGVSGAGKSTVGERLADRLRVPFADADEFHPPANLEKMAAGTPLTDEDRWPWLEAIGRWLGEHAEEGAVATCSALRRVYRDVLRQRAAGIWFLYLDGNNDVIAQRVSSRPLHFMPASLLQSQFDTLEPPDPDERAVAVDTGQPPDEIVDAFLAAIRSHPPGDAHG
jgi:gluconokinase